MFRDKQVTKQYLALVLREPTRPTAELHHFLVKDSQRNVVKAFDRPTKDAKESITRYELVDADGPYFLLNVWPLTGRAHQIRAQLAAIGCSIAGDLKYGAPEPLSDASIALHCYRMTFVHPVRQEPLTVEAPLPRIKWWKDVGR
jgi:23S rRNA pseudouridine1911/1915/1917 synthase